MNALKAEAAARKEAEAKAKREEDKTTIAKALSRHNVPAGFIQPLATLLVSDAKRDNVGGIVLGVQRAWGTEELSLDLGISEFLKTPNGQEWLPRGQASGAGMSKNQQEAARSGS